MIVQMVMACCISRSLRLKIDFLDKNLKNLLVCNHKSFDISYVVYHLVDLYQVCSNYAPGAKNGPAPGVTCFTLSCIK